MEKKCVIKLQLLMKMLMITKGVTSDFFPHKHLRTDLIESFHKLQWLL